MLWEFNAFFLESEPSDNAKRNIQSHTLLKHQRNFFEMSFIVAGSVFLQIYHRRAAPEQSHTALPPVVVGSCDAGGM